MKIALDPFMHRHLALAELPRKVKQLGRYVENYWRKTGHSIEIE